MPSRRIQGEMLSLPLKQNLLRKVGCESFGRGGGGIGGGIRGV